MVWIQAVSVIYRRVTIMLAFDEDVRFPGGVHDHGLVSDDPEAPVLIDQNLRMFVTKLFEGFGAEVHSVSVSHIENRDDFVAVRKRVLEWCKENARDTLWYGPPYAWWKAALNAGVVNEEQFQQAEKHFGYAWHYLGD